MDYYIVFFGLNLIYFTTFSASNQEKILTSIIFLSCQNIGIYAVYQNNCYFPIYFFAPLCYHNEMELYNKI